MGKRCIQLDRWGCQYVTAWIYLGWESECPWMERTTSGTLALELDAFAVAVCEEFGGESMAVARRPAPIPHSFTSPALEPPQPSASPRAWRDAAQGITRSFPSWPLTWTYLPSQGPSPRLPLPHPGARTIEASESGATYPKRHGTIISRI